MHYIVASFTCLEGFVMVNHDHPWQIVYVICFKTIFGQDYKQCFINLFIDIHTILDWFVSEEKQEEEKNYPQTFIVFYLVADRKIYVNHLHAHAIYH